MKINTRLDVDVVALEEDDTVNIMLDLTAPQAAEAGRPSQTVVVVLDRSGSMAGGRLDAAKRALLELVARLDGHDRFALVTFDNRALVDVPAGAVDDLGRPAIRRAVAAVHPGGSTDMSSGYLRGLQEARRAAGGGGATIILMSDGHANTGITDPAQFRRMAAGARPHSITTSTIGVGVAYDEEILAELAIGGAGNHTFAETGDAAAAALAGEVDGLLSKTAQAVSLLIRPRDPVARVTVLNDLPCHGLPDAVMVELGDFYSGEQRRLLVSLDVPAMAGLGLSRVADLELSYVSIPDLQQHTIVSPVSVNVVPQDVADGRVPDTEVRHEKLLAETQKAKSEAARALRRGDSAAASRSLRSSRNALRHALRHEWSTSLAEELDFIEQSIDDTRRRQATYTSRKLSSDGIKKSRGMRDRAQGGSWDQEGTGSDSR